MLPRMSWAELASCNGIPESWRGNDKYYFLCIEWYSDDAQFYIETDWIDGALFPSSISFNNTSSSNIEPWMKTLPIGLN